MVGDHHEPVAYRAVFFYLAKASLGSFNQKMRFEPSSVICRTRMEQFGLVKIETFELRTLKFKVRSDQMFHLKLGFRINTIATNLSQS